jgi:hypothetical protein
MKARVIGNKKPNAGLRVAGVALRVPNGIRESVKDNRGQSERRIIMKRSIQIKMTSGRACESRQRNGEL